MNGPGFREIEHLLAQISEVATQPLSQIVFLDCIRPVWPLGYMLR